MAASFRSPTSTVGGLQFLHLLTTPVGVRGYLTVVLICISLANDGEHLFMCSLAIHIFLLWRNVYANLLCVLLAGLFVFYCWVVSFLCVFSIQVPSQSFLNLKRHLNQSWSRGDHFNSWWSSLARDRNLAKNAFYPTQRIPAGRDPGGEACRTVRAGLGLFSVQFSRSVMSDSLRPNGLQHARSPCPSPTPGVYSNSCPLSRWCHPTIWSSVIPFSSCLQSFPASGSFPMSQFFTSGGQSIGVSASVSVLPMNIQVWFPLGWTGSISLQSKGLSRVFSNTTVQNHQFFSTQLSSQSNSHIHAWLWETIALTRQTLLAE